VGTSSNAIVSSEQAVFLATSTLAEIVTEMARFVMELNQHQSLVNLLHKPSNNSQLSPGEETLQHSSRIFGNRDSGRNRHRNPSLCNGV
jgi:hypothetical protein